MTIGEKLNERMQLPGMDVPALSEASFVEEDGIRNFLENRCFYERIDPFEQDLLCSALSCDPSYFTDDRVRENDLVISTMHRKDSVGSRQVKAALQVFLTCFEFVAAAAAE